MRGERKGKNGKGNKGGGTEKGQGIEEGKIGRKIRRGKAEWN